MRKIRPLRLNDRDSKSRIQTEDIHEPKQAEAPETVLSTPITLEPKLNELILPVEENEQVLTDALMDWYHDARMGQARQGAIRLRDMFTQSDMTDPHMSALFMNALEAMRDLGDNLETAVRDELEKLLGMQPPAPPPVIEGQAVIREDQAQIAEEEDTQED